MYDQVLMHISYDNSFFLAKKSTWCSLVRVEISCESLNGDWQVPLYVKYNLQTKNSWLFHIWKKLSPTCSLRYLYLESVTWTENIKATSLSSRLKIPHFDKVIKEVKLFCFKCKLHFFDIRIYSNSLQICGYWVPEIQWTTKVLLAW